MSYSSLIVFRIAASSEDAAEESKDTASKVVSNNFDKFFVKNSFHNNVLTYIIMKVKKPFLKK